MFEKSTVFILGAGASVDFGYPTGERLVQEIKAFTGKFREKCVDLSQKAESVVLPRSSLPLHIQRKSHVDVQGPTLGRILDEVRSECERLWFAIEQVQPLVIDYFLDWNESLRDIAKLAIASVILDCEQKSRGFIGANYAYDAKPNHRREPDWIRFVMNKLAMDCRTPCDLHRNQVKFITFNYDSTLERRLHASLSLIDLFRHETFRFLDDRIHHVYGQIHGNLQDALMETTYGENTAYYASQHIKTIQSVDKDLENQQFSIPRSWIEEAENVYILGYGFDPRNSTRIGLDTIKERKKNVYFTNYEDPNIVNKSASQLFGAPTGWFNGNTVHSTVDLYVEKSVKCCYQSLALDFGL